MFLQCVPSQQTYRSWRRHTARQKQESVIEALRIELATVKCELAAWEAWWQKRQAYQHVQIQEVVKQVPTFMMQEVLRQEPHANLQETVRRAPVPQVQALEKVAKDPEPQVLETVVDVPQDVPELQVMEEIVEIPQVSVKHVPAFQPEDPWFAGKDPWQVGKEVQNFQVAKPATVDTKVFTQLRQLELAELRRDMNEWSAVEAKRVAKVTAPHSEKLDPVEEMVQMPAPVVKETITPAPMIAVPAPAVETLAPMPIDVTKPGVETFFKPAVCAGCGNKLGSKIRFSQGKMFHDACL